MYAIKKLLANLINKILRWKFSKINDFVLSPDAKINFLGIRYAPKSFLKIGKRSIIEGNIIFEKENASVCIGKNTFIGRSNIICAEKIEIGDDVLIAWGCTIVDHNSHSLSVKDRAKDVIDWYDGKKNWSNVIKKPVKICDGAWIGFNSIILKGVTIGEGAVVGAGSVVTKNIEPYTVVAGNPAKFIKNIEKNK